MSKQYATMLPSLLDRLTDFEPGKDSETAGARTLSGAQYRASVVRDLAWLFNCSNLEATFDLARHPRVRASVLNFGLPSLAGRSLKDDDLKHIERSMRDVIARYEPRVLDHTVAVNVLPPVEGSGPQFRIEAQLRALPMPIDLVVQSSFDPETGQVQVAADPR